MKVSIIIVNYRTKYLTEQCVKSVEEKLKINDYELIIVDNNSLDGSYEYLSTLDSERIKIIKTSRNGGFSYANNIGVQHALGKYLFFLNSDTILKENVLENMIQELEINRNIGALSCQTVNGDNIPIASGHKFSNLKSLALQTLIKPYLPFKLYNLLIKRSVKKNYTDKLCYCDWICGAAILMSKDIFHEIGGWNEEYFMYMEDEELCRKIRFLGYKIAVYSDIGIVHYVGSSGNKSPKVTYEMIRSKLLYYKKYDYKNYKLIKFLLLKQAESLSEKFKKEDKGAIIELIKSF